MAVGEKDEADPTVGEPVDARSPAVDAPAAAEPIEPPDENVGANGAAAVDPEVEALREELATVRRDLDQSSARLRAVSKGYTDLQAENKAFRERMEQRAKQDAELQAYELVRMFFDPVMNLKRSIASPGDDVAGLVRGLQMVEGQFMEALRKLGLEEIPTVGTNFDPTIHEALGVMPVAEKERDGKVIVVHTNGYTVRGRVLQAAQVVIGKYTEVGGEA